MKITLIILLLITGETMAHIKGHINVPAQETKETEVKKSFWDSFKDKTGIDMSTGSMQFKKGHRIKVFKKGGKVSK
jgi:hypothetical protein